MLREFIAIPILSSFAKERLLDPLCTCIHIAYGLWKSIYNALVSHWGQWFKRLDYGKSRVPSSQENCTYERVSNSPYSIFRVFWPSMFVIRHRRRMCTMIMIYEVDGTNKLSSFRYRPFTWPGTCVYCWQIHKLRTLFQPHFIRRARVQAPDWRRSVISWE